MSLECFANEILSFQHFRICMYIGKHSCVVIQLSKEQIEYECLQHKMTENGYRLLLAATNEMVFPLKFMINGTILILILFISGSLLAMSLGISRIECTYLIFVSLEHLLALVTSVDVTKP